MGKPPLTGKLKCTIYNFHEGENASLDDDNMVKPIRDPNRKNHYSKNNYKKMRQMSEQARDKNA
jgi:hypothetical protein